jgi:hypothetical protein
MTLSRVSDVERAPIGRIAFLLVLSIVVTLFLHGTRTFYSFGIICVNYSVVTALQSNRVGARFVTAWTWIFAVTTLFASDW